MKIADHINSYRRGGAHPLTIDGQNIYNLSLQDPAKAYEAVFKEVERRGGLDAPVKFFQRQSCIKQAMAKPLPGAAGDAFMRGALTVDEFTIYEVMPIHLKCLQLVNSPLLTAISAAISDGEKAASPEIEDADEWNLCFIFTSDPEALYDVPKSKLKDFIESGARAQFRPSRTHVVNSAVINGICNAVMKQFERHIATTVKFAAEVEGQSEKKN